MVFADISINFVLGTALEIVLLILKNGPLSKSAYHKINLIISFIAVGLEKFNIYLKYSSLYYDFLVYILCVYLLGTFLIVLGVLTYFNILKTVHF